MALSNQKNLGIYDSRAADGISDLKNGAERLIPIPPGRRIKGDYGYDLCEGFETYNNMLKYLHKKALASTRHSSYFGRVSDLEIAFFARSKLKDKKDKINMPPLHLNKECRKLAFDEGDLYWTLGKGKGAKLFRADVGDKGIAIYCGDAFSAKCWLTHAEIIDMLKHFENRDWFPLGNCIDNVKPGGLGEYFKDILKKSPKFASHYASILCIQHRLDYKYFKKSICLKVISDLK